MKKLVIEINLDSIKGSREEVVGTLLEMVHDISGFPYDDVRTNAEKGFLSARLTHDKELISENVIASVDVVDGELQYTNVTLEYHDREGDRSEH